MGILLEYFAHSVPDAYIDAHFPVLGPSSGGDGSSSSNDDAVLLGAYAARAGVKRSRARRGHAQDDAEVFNLVLNALHDLKA